MQEYKRAYPMFSLCGLNCGLCPRHQTEGASKCPGCGGPDFHLKHPSCAVITCSKKHGQPEFCFECHAYPCERFQQPSTNDSFITYRRVLPDMQKAKQEGIKKYQTELNKKIAFLEWLLQNFNDGKRKGFFCLAVNLLELSDLLDVRKQLEKPSTADDLSLKEKSILAMQQIEEKAKQRNIELCLRK